MTSRSMDASPDDRCTPRRLKNANGLSGKIGLGDIGTTTACCGAIAGRCQPGIWSGSDPGLRSSSGPGISPLNLLTSPPPHDMRSGRTDGCQAQSFRLQPRNSAPGQDSPMREAGFEPSAFSVPCARSYPDPPDQSKVTGSGVSGTGSSNPSPSREESAANLLLPRLRAATTAALMVHAPNFGTDSAHVNGGGAGHHGL